jgi:hypothetical protein
MANSKPAAVANPAAVPPTVISRNLRREEFWFGAPGRKPPAAEDSMDGEDGLFLVLPLPE